MKEMITMSVSSFSVLSSTPRSQSSDPRSVKTLVTLGWTALLSLSLMLLAGCGEDVVVDPNAPVILELDQQEVVVGESLFLYGKNFSEEAYQRNLVYFDGQFIDDLGQVEDVSRSFQPLIVGEIDRAGELLQVLRVNRFGPFRNPLNTTGRPGVFRGKITALVADDNGDEYVGLSEQSFELNVGPSIEITELQPLFANCGAPALRALEGIAYRFGVKAVGIAPVRFEYEFNQVNGVTGLTRYNHTFDSPVAEDFVGDSEPLFFNRVIDGEQFYVTSLRVKAYDAEGNMAETALPLSVHRALEIVYDGKREVAERYEPAPVSGCIPGSIGTRVSYSETKSEFRQRTVSMTVNQNWLRSSGRNLDRTWREGILEGQTQSRTLGSSLSEDENLQESMNISYNQNEANDVNFSETDGEAWRWNVTEGESNSEYAERMSDIYGSGSYQTAIGAEVEGSIPFLAKSSSKVKTTAGVKVGGRTGGTNGTSVSDRSERGYSTSGTTSENRSFGSTTTEGRGQNINNSYALSSSSSQSLSEGDSLSSNRTWNLSEGESSSNVVSESENIAQNLTLTSSNQDSTTQSFSGFIARGRYGIFYRQTTRWVRRAEVRTYNQCGVAQHVGELLFNEFTWAPDLAVASACEDRPPPANLPEKACLISPCNG
jgi:hypothetical protein